MESMIFLRRAQTDREVNFMKKHPMPKPEPSESLLVGAETFCGPIVTDPFGSYTGHALDPEEIPVQDVDDL